jgi:Na+-driven multidrug efflux pump
LSVWSALIYLTLFSLLTSKMGLIGAGVAACVAAILPPLVMVFLIRRSDTASIS